MDINNDLTVKYYLTKDISILLSMRNEIIHNSSWDQMQTVYVNVKNGVIRERYILFPDITAEGTLDKCYNRNHFFSQGNKFNEMLPDLYFTWIKKIIKTLERIIETYRVEE